MNFKICISDRCFFPWSAFKSTRKIVKLAKSLGYEQVEFHPTWSLWKETLLRGKLDCQKEDVCSFHIDWRQDLAKTNGLFIKRILDFPLSLFPPGFIATKILQRLEKVYKKEIVIHWLENIEEYQRPILELQDFLKMNIDDLEKKITVGRLKGAVIDTHKFLGWIKANKLRENSNLILKRLLKNIAEVHFRFKYKKDVDALFGGPETDSIKVMKQLIKLGYSGRVVVEAGWPDAGTVANLWRIDLGGARRTHWRIVKFLKSL